MKDIIAVLDLDSTYSKKFCNQAIKLMGKKYVFLNFTNIKALSEYSNENKIDCVVISDAFIENVDELKAEYVYILNEKNKKNVKEGKKTFLYKLQNIKTILDIIDEDLTKQNDAKIRRNDKSCKLIVFYSPISVKSKIEYIKKIAKYISKKKKVLIVDMGEFSNYKGNVGLSNIIFNYKEENLNADNIKKEVTNIKEQDFIMSVTYPEDFNVINNIDIANIINEMKNVGYDYIFVNADPSYVKSQYILNDANNVIVIKGKENENYECFKKFIKLESQIDDKKYIDFDIDKNDKSYFQAFAKQYFLSNV